MDGILYFLFHELPIYALLLAICWAVAVQAEKRID